jgi:hypothetical protein
VIAPDGVHRERRLFKASVPTRNELVLCASLRIWFFFGHITPCACGVRGASASCDGFGFTHKTAAPFDVFYWLQVTNFGVLFNSRAPNGTDHFDVLFDSSPKRANHFDVWDFGIHAKMDLAGANSSPTPTRIIGRRSHPGQSRRANVGILMHAYEVRPRKDHRGVKLTSECPGIRSPLAGLDAVNHTIRYVEF